MQGPTFFVPILLGMLWGALLFKTAQKMIIARAGSVPEYWLVREKYGIWLWMLINGAAWVLFVTVFGISIKTLEGIFVFSICLLISAVDLAIRKIPNSLLLAVLAVSVILMVSDHSLLNLKDHMLGLAVGLGLFLSPFLIGRPAGAGDIKYAACIGIFLGLYYSLLAFVVMSALFLLYTSVLFLSKKGGFKTKTALGPYMSMGFFVSFMILNGFV